MPRTCAALLACLYVIPLLACPRAEEGGPDEASSTDETGEPAYGSECPDPAGASAFCDALDEVGSLAAPVECTIVSAETIGDSLAMSIEIDCGETSTEDSDTGPSPVYTSLELEPELVQPTLAAEQAVLYGAVNEFLGCEDEDSFVLREPGGELIAAGLYSKDTHVELDLGSAGVLALDYVSMDDEGCLRLDVTLAGQTTRVAARSTQAIQAGDQTFQLDVGSLHVPMYYSDDCGGDFRLFSVLVVRVP